ncbi:MAG: septum formation initiator family protein [Bacteroidales bacterium]|nr:septum formation initiator family protein [Bacteroidales bacterium]
MKIGEWLKKYKWGIALVVFLLYIIFGESGFIQHRKLNKEIQRLERENEEQMQIITTLKEQNRQMQQEISENKEMYFRTHQFLKKDDEDVFRIEE